MSIFRHADKMFINIKYQKLHKFLTFLGVTDFSSIPMCMQCPKCSVETMVPLCKHGQLMEGQGGGVCHAGLLSCGFKQAIPHLCHSTGLWPYLCCTSLRHLEQSAWAGG